MFIQMFVNAPKDHTPTMVDVFRVDQLMETLQELNADAHLHRPTGMVTTVCCVIKEEYSIHTWELAHAQTTKDGTEQTVSATSVPKVTIKLENHASVH